MLSIKPHRIFKREGAHLYCSVPIAMTTAALGGSIEVPTIEGKRVQVKIPTGTQTGQQFRLRNKGMGVINSSAHGDMYVEITVETPVHLSKKQKELLKEFEGKSDKKNSPESESFFKRVKEFWEDLTE